MLRRSKSGPNAAGGSVRNMLRQRWRNCSIGARVSSAISFSILCVEFCMTGTWVGAPMHALEGRDCQRFSGGTYAACTHKVVPYRGLGIFALLVAPVQFAFTAFEGEENPSRDF